VTRCQQARLAYRDNSNTPTLPTVRRISHHLPIHRRSHHRSRVGLHSTPLAVVAGSTSLLEAGLHSILLEPDRHPSLGWVVAHIHIVLVDLVGVDHNLDRIRHFVVDRVLFGFEVAVSRGLSSRKDQHRSGLVEGM